MSTDHEIFKRLGSFAGRPDLTINELVEAAEELLRKLAPRQTRYKVSDRPDVRTIRYYTSQGLLPPPVSYQGGRARYSSQHLTRLLLIKKLQAEHHTLQKIKSVLHDADDQVVLRELLPCVDLDRIDRDVETVSTPGSLPRPAPEQRRQETIKRLTLAHGGAVDIPLAVFDDEHKLRSLADELEAIARQLRETKAEQGGKI